MNFFKYFSYALAVMAIVCLAYQAVTIPGDSAYEIGFYSSALVLAFALLVQVMTERSLQIAKEEGEKNKLFQDNLMKEFDKLNANVIKLYEKHPQVIEKEINISLFTKK